MAAGTTYELITSQTLASDQGSVTFSDIPQTYTDIVFHSNSISPTLPQALNWRINGDSGSNYSRTGLYGDGSSTGSYRNTSLTYGLTGAGKTYPNPCFTSFMNYSNSTTAKTIILTGTGTDLLDGYGFAIYVWNSTSAITQVVFTPNNGGAISAGSSFSLYGIKAA